MVQIREVVTPIDDDFIGPHIHPKVLAAAAFSAEEAMEGLEFKLGKGVELTPKMRDDLSQRAQKLLKRLKENENENENEKIKGTTAFLDSFDEYVANRIIDEISIASNPQEFNDAIDRINNIIWTKVYLKFSWKIDSVQRRGIYRNSLCVSVKMPNIESGEDDFLSLYCEIDKKSLFFGNNQRIQYLMRAIQIALNSSIKLLIINSKNTELQEFIEELKAKISKGVLILGADFFTEE